MFPEKDECERIYVSTVSAIQKKINKTPVLTDIKLTVETVIDSFLACMEQVIDGQPCSGYIIFQMMAANMEANGFLTLPEDCGKPVIWDWAGGWSKVRLFFDDFCQRYGEAMGKEMKVIVWMGSILVDTQAKCYIHEVEGITSWFFKGFLTFLIGTLQLALETNPEIAEQQRLKNEWRLQRQQAAPGLTLIESNQVRQYIDGYPHKLAMPVDELAEFLEVHLGMEEVHQEGIRFIVNQERQARGTEEQQ